MPSPFPGMDPYLEAHWGDIHQRLVIYASDELQSHLPSDLRARVEERVFVHYEEELLRVIVPDVRIRERVRSTVSNPISTQVEETGVATVVADHSSDPIEITIESEPVTEGYIEIIEKNGGRVVTIIEVVSLANKFAGEGRQKYRKKLAEMKKAGVNIVEIDLLRRGPWVLMPPRDRVPKSHRDPYRISVWRSMREDTIQMYQATMQHPLPVIHIPLRPSDKDVPLDLQALIARCYLNGAYDDIDYTEGPDVPLSSADTRWLHHWLCEKGLREMQT